jgi:TPR repeat protein
MAVRSRLCSSNIATAGIAVCALLYLCALQAAAAQHAPAMLYLGKMCLHGHGFPPDYDMALMWYVCAF